MAISIHKIRALNEQLYRWSIDLCDKYSNNALYWKVLFVIRFTLNFLCRISIGGYRLDVSGSSIKTSKVRSAEIVQIRRVSKERKPNAYIFTAHMGTALISETIECLHDFKETDIDLKVVQKGYIQPEKLRVVAKSYNQIITSHLYPERYNLILLEENNIRKFVVHVTDPRLQLVRTAESIINRAKIQKNMELALKNARLMHYVPENYLNLSLSDRIELVCKSGHFSIMIAFANGWMEVKKNILKEWEFDICIARWDDLVLDRKAYFNRLNCFWGLGTIDWENTLLSERHLAKTTGLDWKEELSSHLIGYIDSFVPDELLEFYGWER